MVSFDNSFSDAGGVMRVMIEMFFFLCELQWEQVPVNNGSPDFSRG